MRALTLALLLAAQPAFAHSGGTDSSGCHNGPSGYHCHSSGSGGGGGDYDDSEDDSGAGAGVIIAVLLLAVVGIVVGVAVASSSSSADAGALVCAESDECAPGYACSGSLCRPVAVSTVRVGPTSMGFGISW